MKLTKTLTLLSFIFVLGVTSMFGLANTTSEVKASEEEVTLPSSVTGPIYRYAKAINETHDYVDSALINWLNVADNLGGLDIFENEPASHDSTTNRAVKDGFYVMAYLQQYLSIGVSNAKASTINTSFDSSFLTLNAFVGLTTDLVDFLDYELNDQIEDAYFSCKNLYNALKEDAVTLIENDIYYIYYQPVETFMLNAKYYLKERIDVISSTGIDESLNNYSSFISMLNGYGLYTGKDIVHTDVYTKEITDYILFDANSHIDTYLTKSFIDFDEADYADAIYTASTTEEIQQISAPYIEKLDRQLCAYLLTYKFVTSYIDDKNSIGTFINHFASLFYPVIEFSMAKHENDSPNIILLGFNLLGQFEGLLAGLGLDTNKQDLQYEKYLASMRLGSLAYEQSIFKFSKFLEKMEEINDVNVGEISYEQGVAKIKELVLESYKYINVDYIPNSDQAVLFFANGLEELASREQGYTFEIRKMLNHDHSFPIQTKLLDDYGDNLLYVNIVWIDMVLIDDRINEEIKSIDEPLAVTFGIYNIQIGTDVNIYRYDEATEKAVTLSNKVTQSGTDYFSMDVDDITVHTKDFGTYAIVWLNRLVKEEVESYRTEIEDLKDQVDTLTATIAAKDATIASLQAEIAELNEKVSGLENQVSSLSSLVVSKEAMITKLNNKISELEGKITLLEADINDKQSKIDALNAQIVTLSAQIAAKDASISELTAKVSELESKITTLKADVESKQATITSLQSELADVKETLKEKILQINDLEASVNSKNTLSIIFIILTCVFATSTIALATVYFVKKNKRKEQ